jgi:hypothetical protein
MTENPLATQIAELKAKIEAQAHQQRRLQGYIAKFDVFRKDVVAAIQPSNRAPLPAIREALARLAQPSRPDSGVLMQVPELQDKMGLVLYFKTNEDRQGFTDLLTAMAREQGWQEISTQNL